MFTILHDNTAQVGGNLNVTASFNNTDEPSAGTVYSGVKFGSDGNIYRRQIGGGWGKVGSWFDDGTITDFSITRTINSGTLTTDAGAGPVQLNADRIYDVQQTAPGSKTAELNFVLQNWNGGSPDTTYDNATYPFSATMESP